MLNSGEIMKRIERKAAEHGQSMVELAISLMFVLLIISGLVDLGRAFTTYIAVRDAAQEGAAYAAIARIEASDAMVCNEVTTRVQTTSGTLQGWSDAGNIQVNTTINGTPCGDISPSDVPTTVCLGAAVEVEVEFNDFPLVTPFIGTLIGTQTLTLRASAIDTILTPACQ